MRSSLFVVLLLLAGCADSGQISYRQALANRHASRMAHIEKMEGLIAKLPPEQRQAERRKLSQEIDRWLEEDQRRDSIDAQNNIANSVNDLSDELRQVRVGY